MIAPFFCGTILGFLFPVFDAYYSKWVAWIQRRRENWVKDEVGKIYINEIESLAITLESVVKLVETENQRRIFNDFEANSQNAIRIVRCIKSMQAGDFAKFDVEERIIYAYYSTNDTAYGLVVKKFTDELCLVLINGRIKNSELNAKFNEEGNYIIQDGKYISQSEGGFHLLRKEGQSILLGLNPNTNHDDIRRRFRKIT
ncbi:hypothetical protein EHQ27_18655 [Leptospira wolffii]|uniref:hypothetical protein n=1 Tax=Leptospira wolffii TaxID=409998 RepID=UPI001082BD57|nr:hypothetical protein [Leptospira wolffii]TGK65697.1 hypothetical protein EHQ27_18655 [Leptospira wolffii]